MKRRESARTLTAIAVGAALLLVGCGGDGTNAGNGDSATPGVLLDFDVRVSSGIEAHVVIHASDGSVLEHQPVDVETRRVSFTDVPSDALVTAFARAVRTHWRDGTRVLGSSYEATTFTASHVHGRSFTFGFGGSLWTTVSGPCPNGSDGDTEVVVRVGTSSSWSWCRLDADTEEYRFESNRWLGSGDQQTDGRYSLLVFAEGWTDERQHHFALFLDQTPEALSEGLTVTVDDWRDDFETNTLQVSFPELEDNQWGRALLNLNGLYGGRTLAPHVYTSHHLGAVGESTGEASFPYAPVPAERFGAWQGYSYSDRVDGGWMRSSTNRYDHDVSLPLDTNLDVGTDLWPLLDGIAWVDGATPELSFAWSGSDPTSLNAYVETVQADSDEAFIRKQWRLTSLPGATAAGEALRFPSVPSELAAFVPRPDDVDSYFASVTLFSYVALDTDMPSTAYSVTANLDVWDTADAGAAVALGLDAPRALSDDEAPFQREAESMITLR